MPDVRLIDANALKQLIKSGDDLIFDHATEREILHMIDYQETIDAQPVKRGKWLMHSVEFGDFEGEQTRLKNIEIQTAKCSECGKWVEQVNHIIWSMPFCANCGAKMDGGSE